MHQGVLQNLPHCYFPLLRDWNSTVYSHHLKWDLIFNCFITKAQQRMCFLWQLNTLNLPKLMKVYFFSSITKSILTTLITVWYAADKVIGCKLHSLQDVLTSRTSTWSRRIAADPYHSSVTEGYDPSKTIP